MIKFQYYLFDQSNAHLLKKQQQNKHIVSSGCGSNAYHNINDMYPQVERALACFLPLLLFSF
jgi:hypothetical protein